MKKRLLSALLTAAVLITGCAGSTGASTDTVEPEQQAQSQEDAQTGEADASAETAEETPESDAAEAGADAAANGDTAQVSDTAGDAQAAGRIRGQDASTAEPIESENGNIVILYTNDVHCAVDTTIGYAGFYAYKEAMEEEGNAVFVVDDGDAIQGGTFGSMTKRDASGMFAGFESDERRVSNIMVNGEPLDPEREYTVGGIKYQLINQGDGNTLFDGAEVVDIGRYLEDVDAIAEYLDTFGGNVPEEYADRYGQERIHFISE